MTSYITSARFENGQSVNEHHEIRGESSMHRHCGRLMIIWQQYTWNRIDKPKYGNYHLHCDVCGYVAKNQSDKDALRVFKPMKPKIKIKKFEKDNYE